METYRVKLICPRCGADLSFQKPKNGSSIHYHRMLAHAKHVNARECDNPTKETTS